MYSVISVKLDSLPGNTKKQGIDPFVADHIAISPSLGVFTKRRRSCDKGQFLGS